MHRRIVCLLALFTISPVALAALSAQTRSPSTREYEIKAEFLHKVVPFIDWPEGAFGASTSPLVLCVLGVDPFGPALDSVEGRTAQGRTIEVRRFDGLEDLDECHILFISSSERGRLADVVESLGSSSVLTVGEMEDFAERGGIISLGVTRNRLRFEVNLEAGNRAGLQLSSQLLALATGIISDRR